MNILIVDDDQDILTSFKIGLEDYGYNLTLISNPIEAIEKFKKNKYDLIISDINMPQMNGIQLLMKLKKIDHNIRVILITAFDDFKDSLSAIKNEVFQLFLKPVDIKEVISSIEDIKKKLKN